MQSIHSAQSPAAATRPAARTLDVEDLTVRYGQPLAVDGVTLAIEPGEVVALLGPSGCGKTTLLRVIAGFVRQAGRPRAGRRRADRPPAGQPAQRRHRLPELRPVPAHDRGGERGLRAARPRPARRRRRRPRSARMLDMVQLGGFRERLPRQLSGGQQQRVALARALAVEPSILLLDEPFAALDRNLRLDMQIEVKRLQRQLGLTTILVTHDQDEAMSVADRIAVMNKGTVEQFDTPVAIYDRPQTLFVNGFIGTTNLLPGKVAGARQRHRHRGARRRRQRCACPRRRASRPAPTCCSRCGPSSSRCRPSPAPGSWPIEPGLSLPLGVAARARGAHRRRRGAQDRRAAPAPRRPAPRAASARLAPDARPSLFPRSTQSATE